MKANLARVCAVLLGLVVCAAAQDLSPAVLGAKPPFLLAFGCFAGIPAAIGAGLFADALGGLPFGCSAAFYAFAAIFARLAKSMSIAAAIISAAVYQLWIDLWSRSGNTISALAGTLIAAAVISPLMFAAARRARRNIGIDIQKEAA